jgi:enoyl-CoA hydratase
MSTAAAVQSDEILFERAGRLGLVTLNRPAALNALTPAMARSLDARLRAWAVDQTVQTVAITGAGERAFCAGGDVRAMYDARARSDGTDHRAFYFDEYRLNRRIFRYVKPYVALIDGIVMGGGVGLSVHGRYRAVSEKAVFAMPETAIGLFPDIGGSYFLSRCPGRIGLYLGLSGARLNAADMLYAGLATHFVPRAQFAALRGALETLPAEEALTRFGADAGAAPLAALRSVIDRCFAGDTVEAALAALDREGTDWAQDTAKAIRAKAPLSLKVTLRQLALGATLDLEDCLRMEYRLVQAFMRGHDFFEGVRALLIDKDNKPRWQPARLEDVSDAQVAACFAPPGAQELTFED